MKKRFGPFVATTEVDMDQDRFDRLFRLGMVIWCVSGILGLSLIGGTIFVIVHFLQMIW